jgi:hypothetical protein
MAESFFMISPDPQFAEQAEISIRVNSDELA